MQGNGRPQISFPILAKLIISSLSSSRILILMLLLILILLSLPLQQEPKCRIAQGLCEDLRRRLSHYISDYVDGEQLLACLFCLLHCTMPKVVLYVVDEKKEKDPNCAQLRTRRREQQSVEQSTSSFSAFHTLYIHSTPRYQTVQCNIAILSATTRPPGQRWFRYLGFQTELGQPVLIKEDCKFQFVGWVLCFAARTLYMYAQARPLLVSTNTVLVCAP